MDSESAAESTDFLRSSLQSGDHVEASQHGRHVQVLQHADVDVGGRPYYLTSVVTRQVMIVLRFTDYYYFWVPAPRLYWIYSLVVRRVGGMRLKFRFAIGNLQENRD